MSFYYSNPAGLSLYQLADNIYKQSQPQNQAKQTEQYKDVSRKHHPIRHHRSVPKQTRYPLPRGYVDDLGVFGGGYALPGDYNTFYPQYPPPGAYEDERSSTPRIPRDARQFRYVPEPSADRDAKVDVNDIIKEVLRAVYGDEACVEPDDLEDEVGKLKKEGQTRQEAIPSNHPFRAVVDGDEIIFGDEIPEEEKSNLFEVDLGSKENKDTEDTKPKINQAFKEHASAPSPITDPLQISTPQLRTNLPFSPSIDVYDKPDEYIVVVALPGGDKNSFNIDFHPSSHELIIKGTIKNKYIGDEDSEKYLKVAEQRFGAFERSVRFPNLPGIQDSKINAKYNNGLLEIVVPKESEEKVPKAKRKITIETVEDEELKRESNGEFSL